MNTVVQSINTIKYRLGKMGDDLLHTLDVPVHARDYFCAQPITPKPSDDYLAAIHNTSYILQDKNIKSTIMYHPVLNHAENQDICLKFIAHEAGHALIHNDNLTAAYTNIIASFKNYIYTVNVLHAAAATAVVCLDKTPRRRFFKEFAKCLGLFSFTAAQTEYLPLHQSRNNERKSDRISDAIVPEYTMKEAFTDLDTYCVRNDIPIFTETKNTFPTLRTLLSTHPHMTERFAASEENCKKFAKNSLLWN
jgi:Zn-dependent protease with chaperone function